MVFVEAVLNGNFAVVLSASQDQVNELYRRFKSIYQEAQQTCGEDPYFPAGEVLVTQAEFSNGGRVLTRPASERSSRGFHGAKLLVLDEAARIPDDLFAGVIPSVSMAGGRIVAMSTPFGKRGWFYEQWDKAVSKKEATRFTPAYIPWDRCPRVTPRIVADYRILAGEMGVRQEYLCEYLEVSLGSPFNMSNWRGMLDDFETQD